MVYETPGVYIEELPATGPIAGVGTSTAVFIGPALSGPINLPTKVTNWTQFRSTFGDYNVSPRLYMAHAVRGYFDNGGTVAYIVRVGTAVRAFQDVADRAAGFALHVEALKEGTDGNTILVTVQDAQIVPVANGSVARKARAAMASGANNVITLQNINDAALFSPGDWVTVEGSAERARIDRLRGTQVFLLSNLGANYGNVSFVRIANLAIGQKTFRIANSAGIEPGSVVHLAQKATTENIVINNINNGMVTIGGGGLANAYPLAQADPDVVVTTFEFNLVFTKAGPPAVNEPFLNLSMDPRHSRYFGSVVNSSIVSVSQPTVPSVALPPDNRPAVGAGNLANGVNDNIATLGLNQYQTGLTTLEKVSDANLICVPGRTDTAVQQAVVAHCEKMADRFAILDPGPNLPPFGVGSVLDQRGNLVSARGYAALYYPWIRIMDPTSLTGTDTLLVPPSGHIAGIFARSDSQRGVHKAPANEYITGAVDLQLILSDAEQGELNINGVNGLRVFPGHTRPIVWGARTTTDQTAWIYINVRRLFLFIEKSIQLGINWAVFEPNDHGLWKKLDRSITEFLTRVWRSGALFGKTADEAFYVKIDEELNPPEVRALGQVIIEIGIAPVRPAEFVIVRIAMWDGGSQANES